VRILRTAALALAALVLCGTGTAAAAAGSAAAPGASPAACTGEISLTEAFTQSSYSPGQTVTVNLTAVNCTSQALTTHLIPYGRFTDAANNIAQGCPAIDPIELTVAFAPNATYTTSFSYMVFPSCLAISFQAVDTFYDATTGAQIAQATPTVPIVQPKPPVGCHVTFTLQSEWQGGFSAALSITNTGLVADNGWKLTFTFGGDQQVGVVWGATATQSGQNVTLVNLPYDATIAPGATLTGVGMNGSWSKSDAAPSGFAVNGTACT
jgi:hypothetical protein